MAVFNFQQNEKSTHIHVAFLLYATLKDIKYVHIVPSLDIEIPFTKKGLPYNTDFVIFRKVEQLQREEQPSEAGPSIGLVVYHNSFPIIVIEIKAGIPIDFFKVTPQHYMELFIYCIYIMRMKKTDVMLGCVTDGKT